MSASMTRKAFLSSMALAALGLAACGSSQVGETKQDTTGADTTKAVYDMTEEEEQAAWEKEPRHDTEINIGYGGGLCLGAFGIAKSQGFYDAEGLKVNIMNVESKIDAVGTGKVDVIGTHIASLLVPALNDVPMTFTLGLHSGCKSMYTLADSEFKSTSDLVGKTVAIPEGVGSADHNIAMRFFSRDDIDPNDIEWKQVAKDACPQALQNGEVQAAILEDQFAQPLVQQGLINYVRSLTYDDDFNVEPCCILAFNREFMKENPVTVKKYTRAIEKAGEWIQENTEQALEQMLENNWASGDKGDDLELMNAFDYTITEQRTKDSLLDVISDYQKFGIVDSSLKPDDVLAQVWAPVLGKVD